MPLPYITFSLELTVDTYHDFDLFMASEDILALYNSEMFWPPNDVGVVKIEENG